MIILKNEIHIEIFMYKINFHLIERFHYCDYGLLFLD